MIYDMMISPMKLPAVRLGKTDCFGARA